MSYVLVFFLHQIFTLVLNKTKQKKITFTALILISLKGDDSLYDRCDHCDHANMILFL